MSKFIVTFFLHKKNNLEHYGHNVKKQGFFKTLFRSSKLDIYKCPNFISLFTFGKIIEAFEKEKKGVILLHFCKNLIII